jgi:serine/threonine protein kinase/tetratricopeptide (TPR) repeat protein
MATTDHAKLKEVFGEARRLEGRERAIYLELVCGGDAALRAGVEDLLAALERAGDFLSEATVGARGDEQPGDGKTAELGETAGMRIGPYKLLQQIGEGGFGVVFMAEQQEPVIRRVALKIIKVGMDTRQVIARFEAERQALAMMDHPNIARVLDAGATSTGRPYFVMELVRGEPITAYCDRERLSIPARLELFTQVCNAVQHAHQKGVIHRDIKPSNVLVTVVDGKPVPKVIDFGIAKATISRLTEKTLFTEHRALIGTPEYMSPEQADMGASDIDTRSDIYSLGVLLYELLTGVTPLDAKGLRSAAFAEMQRIIREEEPPKPSTRLSTLETLASVAAQRTTEPKHLGALVRGELDWIVMKCLEKERSRRYETANGLAADVQRHLVGEAVVAAPPSRGYRLRKFVRRNKGPVAAVAAVAAALLIGLVGFAWEAKAARKQEAEAKKQEAEAKKQAAIAEAVAKFQTDMLGAADPDKLLGDKVTVLQAMQAAVKELDKGSLKDQPLVEAGVRDTIGDTLHGLARYDDAEPNVRKSLAIRRAVLPPGHPDIATSLNNLAALLYDQNKLGEAEPLFREALAIRRAALPAGHPSISESLGNLAVFLQAQNKLGEAEPLFREALAIERAAHPAGHPNIALALNNLAVLLKIQNKLAEAEPLYREALAIKRAARAAGHPDIARSLNNLAMLLQAQNKLGEAEPLFREALQIRRASLPAGHTDIATSLNNLGMLLQAQNKLAEAEPLLREALTVDRAALPSGHPDIARGLNNLAELLREQSKFAEAEPLYREALAIWRKALPAGHPNIASGLNGLAELLREQSKFAEAEPLYREALAIRRAALPAGHPGISESLGNLALLLMAQKNFAEAEPLSREALQIDRAALPTGHPDIATDLNNLAGLLEDQNKLAEAEPLYREALAIYRAALPTGHPQIANCLSNLAYMQHGLGKAAEARTGWDEAIAMLRQGSPEGSALLARVLWRSGSARLENNDAVAALPELEEAAAMAWRFLPPDHPDLKRYRETLAKCRYSVAK